MGDMTTREGRAEMRAQFAAFADTDEVPLIYVKAGHLRTLLDAADQRDRYREALEKEVVRMEYDYPGDSAEECGLWCHLCNEHVEADGAGHATTCLLARPAALTPPGESDV